jgi:hypothetical protein
LITFDHISKYFDTIIISKMCISSFWAVWYFILTKNMLSLSSSDQKTQRPSLCSITSRIWNQI